jgi:hypothetical protein
VRRVRPVTARECVRGCLGHDGEPREAADGTRLCRPDLYRLDDWLDVGRHPSEAAEGSLPWVATWLRACYREWPWRAVEVLTSITKGDPPAPSSGAILDALVDLDRAVDHAVDRVRDPHRLRGPDPGATLWQRTRWLSAHREQLAGLDDAGHVWQMLGEVTSHAHALAPWRPAPVRHDGVRCPECLGGPMVTFVKRRPATDDHGHPTDPEPGNATCQACGWMLDPDQFRRWVLMAAAHYRPAGPWRWADPNDWDAAARAAGKGA